MTKHHLMHYGKPLAGKYVRGVDRCCWSPQSFCKKFHQTNPPTQHSSVVIPTLGSHGSTSVRDSHTTPMPLPRWSLVNPASSWPAFVWQVKMQTAATSIRALLLYSQMPNYPFPPVCSTPPHRGAVAISSFLKSSST